MILIRILLFFLLLGWILRLILRLLARSIKISVLRHPPGPHSIFGRRMPGFPFPQSADDASPSSASRPVAVSDPFKVLGVLPGTPLGEIQLRYQQLVEETKASLAARGFSETDSAFNEELGRLHFALQAIAQTR